MMIESLDNIHLKIQNAFMKQSIITSVVENMNSQVS